METLRKNREKQEDKKKKKKLKTERRSKLKLKKETLYTCFAVLVNKLFQFMYSTNKITSN